MYKIFFLPAFRIKYADVTGFPNPLNRFRGFIQYQNACGWEVVKMLLIRSKWCTHFLPLFPLTSQKQS